MKGINLVTATTRRNSPNVRFLCLFVMSWHVKLGNMNYLFCFLHFNMTKIAGFSSSCFNMTKIAGFSPSFFLYLEPFVAFDVRLLLGNGLDAI